MLTPQQIDALLASEQIIPKGDAIPKDFDAFFDSASKSRTLMQEAGALSAELTNAIMTGDTNGAFLAAIVLMYAGYILGKADAATTVAGEKEAENARAS